LNKQPNDRSEGLSSPVGRYKPELLLLAPEGGEDLNTLSFTAQCIELGLAIELDEHWRLPTAPPKELSSYKVCIFPETARAMYDRDLNAFHRDGGFVPYFKYYPLQLGGDMQSVHHYLQSYGRDVYFWTLANVAIEGGLTPQHPDFVRTMESRSARSILQEYRDGVFAKYAARSMKVWTSWGDPQVTFFLSNFAAARLARDEEWKALVDWLFQKLIDSKEEALSTRAQEVQLSGVVESNITMMAWMILHHGVPANHQQAIATGLELARHFSDAVELRDGLPCAKYMRYLWGETMLHVPSYYWLGKLTGEKKYTQWADALVDRITEQNLRLSGIWHHWSDDRGNRGGAWSRGVYWAVLGLTQSLAAMDPGSERAQRIVEILRKTYRGLADCQDREKKIWHLVMDEPETRVETSASAGLVFCHDRLREMGVFDTEHDEMIDRAFVGLKRLWYGGGLAASCRGTATGVPEYYRTRPMGWYGNSLFPATVAARE